MNKFLDLLALVVEYVSVCRDGFHTEVGEHDTQYMHYRVLQSAAGYYLGYFCPVCGPDSRCSHYMTRAEAEEALECEMRGCVLYYASI